MEKQGAFGSKKPRTFMCYIVCDVSRSMWDVTYEDNAAKTPLPYQVIADALPDLIDALDENEQVRDIARLSLITFADEPQVVVPLTQLRELRSVPALPKGVETDYRAVFAFLNDRIRSDAQAMSRSHSPYRPIVYFITDGDPQKDGRWQDHTTWERERDRLLGADFDLRPSVVALGFGNVKAETLKRVASSTPPGAACVSAPGESVRDLLKSMLETIVVSITQSSAKGGLEFETPNGWTRLQ